MYVQLKGFELYENKNSGKYSRIEFHEHPELYRCKFLSYCSQTDILLNGVYWDKQVPRLFEKVDVTADTFIIQTIADVTDDTDGSVPINLGDQSIEHPVYGVDKTSFLKTEPYLPNSIDIMAVGNLPNELPKDASRYFGEQLIKFVLKDIVGNGSDIIERATIVKAGELTSRFEYLRNYAEGSAD